MSIHDQLGGYSNAVANLENAVAAMQKALREVVAKAGAFPISIFDEQLSAKISTLANVSNLGLSLHYSSSVVPAVKAAAKEA